MVNERRELIGQILIRERLITQEQLDRALDRQTKNRMLIGKTLLRETNIGKE
jgi:hypothetical protein